MMPADGPAPHGPKGHALLDDAAAARLLPERLPRSHKGTFGRVVVVAGSLDYAGAALLVAGAAARTGAGLVTLAVARSLQPVVAGRLLEVTTLGLAERVPGVFDPVAAHDALVALAYEAMVVGPGLPSAPETDDLVRHLLADAGGPRSSSEPAPPAVVDAEALNGLARRPGWWEEARRPSVLTPHPGEFRRLCAADAGIGDKAASLGDDERAEAAGTAARRWGQVVVLKGARTVVASPTGSVAVAPFENPALATAGSGDVLAGAIGALLAQGLSTWDAARLGVYLHGMAGAAVREALGDAGAVAPDLLVQLPLAWRRLAGLRAGRGRLGFAPSREPAH